MDAIAPIRALLLGYLFVSLDYVQRNRSIRESGHRLYFRIAAWAALFFGLGAASHVALGLIGQKDYLVFLLGLERFAGKYVIKGLSGSILAITIFATAWWALIYALKNRSWLRWMWGSPLNPLKSEAYNWNAETALWRRSVMAHINRNNEFAMLIYEAADPANPRTLLFTLKNRKAYVGFVDTFEDSTATSQDEWVKVWLVRSGYRHEETLEAMVDKAYWDKFDAEEEENSQQLGVHREEEDDQIPDEDQETLDVFEYRVVIPIAEIVSVHPFDEALYEPTHAPDPVPTSSTAHAEPAEISNTDIGH